MHDRPAARGKTSAARAKPRCLCCGAGRSTRFLATSPVGGSVPADGRRAAGCGAVAAPSMHNTQPWRFRVSARRSDHRAVRRPGADAAVQRSAGPRASTSPAAPRCSTCDWRPRLRAASPWSGCFPTLASRCCSQLRLAGPYRPGEAEPELHAAITGAAHQPRAVQRPPGAARRARRTGCRPPDAKARRCTSPARRDGPACCTWSRTPSGTCSPTPPTAPSWPSGRAGTRDREGIPDSALGPRDPATAPRRCATSRPAGPAARLRLVRGEPAAGRPVHAVRHAGRTGCAPGRRCSGCC